MLVLSARWGRLFRVAPVVLVLACVVLLSARAYTQPAADAEGPRSLLSRVRLGDPQTSGALTIVPIRVAPFLTGNVRTLAEALRDKALVVQEIGEGRVNELYVENRGAEPVFIMAGQILVGARQNRVLKHDLLLPAKSGRVVVEAFCVQHGRWHYEGDKTTFSHSQNVSNPSVRAAASQTKEQGQVWGAVADTQRKSQAPNRTQNLDEVYSQPEVQGRIKKVLTSFETLPDRYPDMQGAVAILDGRVLAVDLFGQRKMFRSLWSPLLASYVLEAGKTDVAVRTDYQGLARAFLKTAASATAVRISTPGGGRLLEFSAQGLSGMALVAEAGLLHMELFPRSARPVEKRPVPNEPPMQRPYHR